MPDLKEIFEVMQAPSKEDKALIEKAYIFAKEAHKDQKRFSGEPYLTHLSRVAKTLAELGMGPKTISAGLLHDTIEDTNATPEQIEKNFGKEILFLVEGVTKLGRLKYHGIERHRESLRKLLVATGKDVRVLIIKLMDRLHNMRTLEFVREEKRQRIALETLDIYAAIAHRLGMGVVRKELEDLAFKYAYPEEFAEAQTLLTERAKETQTRLENMIKELRKELAKEHITKFETDYRVKGLWSLWQKIKRKGGDISKVYDVAAIRIVVEDIPACYRVLGLVHNLWQPLVGKIKDYIAFPKPNGYQSLHTTVFTGDGSIVEIQIRTRSMHRESMYGIAAHVTYKEPGKGVGGGRGSSFDWIKSLIPGLRRNPAAKEDEDVVHYRAPAAPEWLTSLGKSSIGDADFDTTLKTDLFSHRVFVFTPKGDVVDLPLAASPVDFAYAIHSDLGNHIAGAKVNGKMVSLDTVLHNGDIVEIQTKKSAHPTKKWLDFAKTTLARRHIRNATEEEKKS
ncbi:MAG: HD domain-containing protein [Candidatus Adlerbacteria bacterium]|nr:HD domain-containing protein [Candidatus Adlerbacteria bacterium]MDZ4226197.1 HD domain-containing protein [Patescibacteria group bacterium]